MEIINKRIMLIDDINKKNDYSVDECDIRYLVKATNILNNDSKYSILVDGKTDPIIISKEDYEQLSEIQKDNVKSGRTLQPNSVNTVNEAPLVHNLTHTWYEFGLPFEEVVKDKDTTNSNKAVLKYGEVTDLVQENDMFRKDTNYYVKDFSDKALLITKEQFEQLSYLIEERAKAIKSLKNELAEIVDIQNKVN